MQQKRYRPKGGLGECGQGSEGDVQVVGHERLARSAPQGWDAVWLIVGDLGNSLDRLGVRGRTRRVSFRLGGLCPGQAGQRTSPRQGLT